MVGRMYVRSFLLKGGPRVAKTDIKAKTLLVQDMNDAVEGISGACNHCPHFKSRVDKRLKTPKGQALEGQRNTFMALSLLVLSLELVSKGKLSSLLLQLGELILVFGHLLEGGLDKLALHV